MVCSGGGSWWLRGESIRQGLTNSTRDGVEHKPVFSLHLQHGVEEVATGGLLGKSQRSLELVLLLVGVEFSLAERNHTWMHIQTRG